jgi:hypothetical protein
MIELKPRMWTMMGLGAMALVGVSACQPGGEAGASAGEGGEAGPVATAEKSGAAVTAASAVPAVSGESGEAGAQNAYSDIPESSRLGLRIAHVTGFVLIAQKSYDAGQVDEASVLISQGLLEVYAPNAGELDGGAKGLKAAFEKIVTSIDAKKPKAETDAAFASAIKLAREAELASGAAPKDIISAMLSIGAGLYSGAVVPSGNDPIEYQHAQGAMLGAKAAFEVSKSKLTVQNSARTATLGKDVDAVVALFPTVTIPDTPASVAEVTGAASRAQLALSGIR